MEKITPSGESDEIAIEFEKEAAELAMTGTMQRETEEEIRGLEAELLASKNELERTMLKQQLLEARDFLEALQAMEKDIEPNRH